MIVLLLAGPAVFVIVRAMLQQLTPYAFVHVLNRWIEAAKDAKVLLISQVSGSQKVRSIETPVTPQTDQSHPLGVPTGRKGQMRRVVIWVIVMILAPTIGLLLIEFVSYIAGVPSLPDWMKRLGIVSQQQGRVFGLSLIVILVVTGILVYAVLAIFDALGERYSQPVMQGRLQPHAF